MTLFEFERMQAGDAVRVKRGRHCKLLRIAGKRGCFLLASDGNEYEMHECEPIPLTDVQTLMKLGFRKQFGMFTSDTCYSFGWLDIYETHICILLDENGGVQRGVTGYKFLHQAQQKFRELHNEELKLKYDK